MKKKKIAALLSAATMMFSMGAPEIMANYAPYSFSSIEAHAAEESTKKTEDFVKRMYNLVLGREADTQGMKNWTEKLNKHTAKASDIVMGFFYSDEYEESLIYLTGDAALYFHRGRAHPLYYKSHIFNAFLFLIKINNAKRSVERNTPVRTPELSRSISVS